ncbi:MAG: POTRA domain-containing protein [Bacteroidota bacterium]
MKRSILILSFTSVFFPLFFQNAFSKVLDKNKDGISIEYLKEIDDNTNSSVVIGEIFFKGNHVTKPHIIQRELLFKTGDTLLTSQFETILSNSRENLLNTSLFNFVEIDAILSKSNSYIINISFTERWYLWPFPTLDIHERNVNTWLENPSINRVSYGIYLVKENFRGRMEKIRFNFRMGYNERYAFSYSIPYLNIQQKLGLTLSAGMSRTREISYMSIDNKQIFYKNPNEAVIKGIYAQTLFTYRKSFYNTHYLNLRYNNLEFADTLRSLNPLFFSGDENSVQYFSFRYEFISDYRNIKAYPLKGYFNKLTVLQQGINSFSNDISPIFSIKNSYRKYWDLNKNWYFAAGINLKASLSSQPDYFLQKGLGYDNDFVRGYEYHIVDAQHFAVLKTNLKYNIVPQRVTRIGFIPGDKFGLLHYAIFINAFADAGYAADRFFYDNNMYSNTLLGGAGLGIDFVTYYDKVFRTEFTINRHGRFDVYFHLVAPI